MLEGAAIDARAVDALLSIRLAVILLIAALSGATTGVLTFLSYGVWPAAVLAGLAAGGAAIKACDSLIAR